jgi:hypothetical protein
MNERILIVINKNLQTQIVDYVLPAVYNLSKAKDLVTGKEYEVKYGALNATVDGTGYLILKLD